MGHIVVNNIGKAYKRYSSQWARLLEWFDPTGRPHHEAHWVLRGVNFTVAPGEAVGIVGRNGAGKSTLLKIIAGTTQPTEGTIEIGGKIAALLELGLGFHPDFTGRQNVYMSGQLLGLSTAGITQLMPDIESFADIGDYIDQPLRTYSSGMQIRLAFALATARVPDILIVDEALSVGDAAFQKKCFQKIEDFREKGCTLLFVSHGIDTVLRLCSKAIYLGDGVVKAFGDVKPVCDTYERHLFGNFNLMDVKPDRPNRSVLRRLDPDMSATVSEIQYGNSDAVIEHCWLEDASGQEINILEGEEVFYWKYRVKFTQDSQEVRFGMMIKTREGLCVYATHTIGKSYNFSSGDTVLVSFRLINHLVPGIYYLNAGMQGLIDDELVVLHRRVDTHTFKVRPVDNNNSPIIGLAEMNGQVAIQQLWEKSVCL